jgi:hypothetical protein
VGEVVEGGIGQRRGNLALMKVGRLSEYAWVLVHCLRIVADGAGIFLRSQLHLNWNLYCLLEKLVGL